MTDPTAEPVPSTPAAECTGLTARWCPIHGDCRCGDLDADGEGNRQVHEYGPMDDPRCPLHARTSTHAEPLAQGGIVTPDAQPALLVSPEAIAAYRTAHDAMWRDRAPTTQGEAVEVARDAIRAGLGAAAPLLPGPGRPADRGICGAEAALRFEGQPPTWCTLLAGHPGWHHSDSGGHWSKAPDERERAAYERGKAEGIAEQQRAVADALIEVDHHLGALSYIDRGGIPYVEREWAFDVVNKAAKQIFGDGWSTILRAAVDRRRAETGGGQDGQ